MIPRTSANPHNLIDLKCCYFFSPAGGSLKFQAPHVPWILVVPFRRGFVEFFILDSSFLCRHHKSHLYPSLHLQVVPMLMGNCLLLFLWCLLDKSFVSPIHSSSQSRMGKEQHRNMMSHRKHSMMGVHRVKRGWVWNQFFVLEEYMGSDPQYVGKVRLYLFSEPMFRLKVSGIDWE